MPIQFPDFPSLTRGQVSIIPGAQAATELQQKMLANALNQYKLQQEANRAQYYPRLNLAEILKAEAEPPEIRARTGLYGQQANEIQQMLPGRVRELEQKNQYYAPNIQSEIALRNQQANEIQQLLPGRKQEYEIKNKYLPEMQQAQINNYNALSNYRNMGGAGMGVGQKEIMGLQRQLMTEHPEWTPDVANQAACAYLSGTNQLPDGTKLPELSGLGQTYVAQIHRRNSTAAIQNQAANMSALASDISEIDIAPVKRFAGLKGRADYARYSTDMALGKPVPQEFRDYEAFKNITANFAQDALRKGFGTSVVPDYVFATLGAASNPASKWWHDPQQVETNWKRTSDWINSNAQKYRKLGTQGFAADISNSVKKNNPVAATGESRRTVWTRDASGKLVQVQS